MVSLGNSRAAGKPSRLQMPIPSPSLQRCVLFFDCKDAVSRHRKLMGHFLGGAVMIVFILVGCFFFFFFFILANWEGWSVSALSSNVHCFGKEAYIGHLLSAPLCANNFIPSFLRSCICSGTSWSWSCSCASGVAELEGLPKDQA